MTANQGIAVGQVLHDLMVGDGSCVVEPASGAQLSDPAAVLAKMRQRAREAVAKLDAQKPDPTEEAARREHERIAKDVGWVSNARAVLACDPTGRDFKAGDLVQLTHIPNVTGTVVRTGTDKDSVYVKFAVGVRLMARKGLRKVSTIDSANGTITHGVAPIDLLDVEYDGVKLRDIVTAFELLQREHHLVQCDNEGNIVRYGNNMPHWFIMNQNGEFTPAQRAAVSAHWSAQLRAKVQASTKADAERERTRVTCDTWSDVDE